ncbi:CG13712 [Drosophila busckii]|uniref:CG13712 n=1 Tax=Drosophila busckii TaxID=30019 RepID=A0A0M4EMN9_DROBS|nr:uncharacterized protein LOC108597945 [Drosophila busckii]ALC43055.1 CG13712 [Drosophila busckii]
MSKQSKWHWSNVSESLSYALYLHRQELRRALRYRRLMRVASTKLQLTNELIEQARRQWLFEVPSDQQEQAMQRERQYRDALKQNMQRELERRAKQPRKRKVQDNKEA